MGLRGRRKDGGCFLFPSTPGDPFEEPVLPVSTTLGSVGIQDLVSTGAMLLPGDAGKVPLNFRPHVIHFL